MPGKYGAHSAKITTSTGSAIMSVTDSSIPANSEVVTDDSGAIYDKFIGIASVSPVPQFTTRSVVDILKTIGLNGGCLGPANTLRGLEQFFESKDSCASAAANDISFDTDAGFFKLNQLTASRTEPASISSQLDALSTGLGTVEPIAKTEPATLPTSPDISQFVLAGVEVAGINCSDTTGITLNFGVELSNKEPAMGSIYPVDIARTKVRPNLSLPGTDLGRFGEAGIPLDGKTAVHADTTLIFKKRKNRSAFEADSAAVHWSMTLSGLFYFDTIADGSGSADATNSLTLRCAEESTVAPIVFSFDEILATI